MGRLLGGAVTWEPDGGRREVQLEVVELARGGRLERAGLWAPRAGLSWTRRAEPAAAPPPDSMTNRTFTVLIAPVLIPPGLLQYVFYITKFNSHANIHISEQAVCHDAGIYGPTVGQRSLRRFPFSFFFALIYILRELLVIRGRLNELGQIKQ